MSTSSGRKNQCSCCGHQLNEHSSTKGSKCKKCKKVFDICQAGYHGQEGFSPLGWRICKVPCSCGERYYPDKAKAAHPLQPHEYDTEHPAYCPLEMYADPSYADVTAEVDTETSYSYSTWPTASSGAQGATEPYQSETSLGKQPVCAPQSMHRRTFSEESEDQLAWDPEKYEAETLGLSSAIAGLAISGESSYQAEESMAPTMELVSARLNSKDRVEFKVKNGENKEESSSSKGKWKREGEWFVYRRSDGRVFYTKEIKKKKK